VQASPGATITVNSTADTNARDEQMTLREAMLLATGGLAVSTLDEGECGQVSNSSWNGSCSTTESIGAASADTIAFDTTIFSPGSPRGIHLSSGLPALSTGSDTVDASAAGVVVDGFGSTSCFEITSSGNSVKGIDALSCGSRGVYIHGTAQGNIIGGVTAPGQCSGDCNNIGGGFVAVEISGTGASGNVVSGNRIDGPAVASPTPPATPAPMGYPCVLIREGAHNNTIGGASAGQGNTIWGRFEAGVRVDGALTTGNAIRGNSIDCDWAQGIENMNGGNLELALPVIDAVGGSVSGHTSPKCYPCTVDIFSDAGDDGTIYHGSTVTNNDATGTWTYGGSVTGPYITATVTDNGGTGNTSEFSVPVAYSSPAVGGIAELPALSGAPSRNRIALPASVAALALVLTAGAWYAKRRWHT
jgi:hypothetical protein